jgi:hypothetical protein
MNAKITIELTGEEAYAIAKYLPDKSMYGDEPEETLGELKGKLCEVLNVKPWDL